MERMTEKEIHIAALRYAGVRTLALVLVIGLNLLAAIGFGYDVRNWEWWAVMPLASIAVPYTVLRINEALGGE